ncbi:hypothetical protein DSM43518_02268 [Mycobacterium marinum]|uniref:Uncharacterized protein n=1 Tax=Mycobacterium marinum TaxID=1781 RepID=A0A3E2N1Q4_MYCMR|nr:hypothetical protein DE4381_03162 [Mycobacterium marinum]RFZ10660.1 hypothetical protein DSM43518_02268 [Mycobacterium marinum]RFZ46775.1 hypothetical protein DAVIS_00604 [Mycobacterium marinum]RFZ47708.1 hypothetical protein MSS4_03186 [Mycobacterium marinum]RFZ52329.1 hypothetical protein MSS2_03339 [Mycobacterium marinum]
MKNRDGDRAGSTTDVDGQWRILVTDHELVEINGVDRDLRRDNRSDFIIDRDTQVKDRN